MALTIRDMELLASSRGYRFLDDTYEGTKYPHRWRCDKGHGFSLCHNKLLSRGCQVCGFERRRQKQTYTRDYVVEFSKKLGYVLLSKEYVGARKLHEWVCQRGHKFSMTPDNLKRGHNCKECVLGKRRFYKSDAERRLAVLLRTRLNHAIRACNKGKLVRVGSAVRDLGCTVPALKQHLENQLRPGMSWDNWGYGSDKWHIDHIRPMSSFDLTKREELLQACHYTNLQPLWQIENFKKSAHW